MKQPFLIRRVKGASMSPNLRPGQIVVGWNHGEPRAGEIIIFQHDGLEKLKRIYQIENGKFFVLGDNLTESKDSRQFGYIGNAQILGRIVWPRGI